MPRHVVLLRGVNVVRTNRVSMPALRQALGDDGFEDVKTYVQSGNVVLSSKESSERIEQRVRGLLKKAFGLDIAVVVRSHRELKLVVKRNPLARVATNPKRYLVTFLSARPPGEVMEKLKKVAGPEERFVVVGKEIYAWFPEGVAALRCGKDSGRSRSASPPRRETGTPSPPCSRCQTSRATGRINRLSRAAGGTGRRARLRGVWGNPSGFESRVAHFNSAGIP